MPINQLQVRLKFESVIAHVVVDPGINLLTHAERGMSRNNGKTVLYLRLGMKRQSERKHMNRGGGGKGTVLKRRNKRLSVW